MGIALGLGAALSWGLADYFAAVASRHVGTLRVVLGFHLVAMIPLTVLALATGVVAHVSSGQLAVFVLLGAVGWGSYLAFYGALAIGPISVLSPIISGYAAVTALLAVLIIGERLSAFQAVAVSVAIVGAMVASADLRGIARAKLERRSALGFTLALAAMALLGGFVFGVSYYRDSIGWLAPIFLARGFAAAFLLVHVLVVDGRLRPTRQPRMVLAMIALLARLLDVGLRVLALHPNQVAAARARFRASGGKSDRFDAFVICELARTDSHRFRVLEPDSDQTKAIKALTRAREDLVRTRVALANQLRSELERFWPGPVGLFSSLDSPISLAFLKRYPSPLDARKLGVQRLATFLRNQRYSGGKAPAELLEKLRAAAVGCAGETEMHAGREIALALVATLSTLGEQVKQLDRQIAVAVRTHPDGEIFLSLFKGPDSVLTAATLLAEIGDCRARYPTRESLAGDAGQAPVAVESGKHKVARYRWACNKRLRDAFCTLADSTRHWHPWAADRYAAARARGQDHQRAIRTLGRAWSRILWRCWQDAVPYDIALHHGAQQHTAVLIPTPCGSRLDVPATQRMAGDALSAGVDVGPVQSSPRAAQPSPPKERSKGGQSKVARQGRAQRAA